jgi:hypothetical protein
LSTTRRYAFDINYRLGIPAELSVFVWRRSRERKAFGISASGFAIIGQGGYVRVDGRKVFAEVQ